MTEINFINAFVYTLLVLFIVLFTIVACKWQDEYHHRIAIEQDQDLLLEDYISKCAELETSKELVLTQNEIINELQNKYPSPECDESCFYHCTKGGQQPPECVNK